jgi:CBS domain-containing protein
VSLEKKKFAREKGISMKVSNVMTTKVTTVRSSDSLATAAQLMWDTDCGSLPVLDAQGHAVGMITDRDICMATWSKCQPPNALSVSEAMSQELYHVTPDDSLAYTEGLMRSKQIRRVPVLDDGMRLVGILSLADFARHGALEGRRELELGPEQITMVLARICQPPLAAEPSF